MAFALHRVKGHYHRNDPPSNVILDTANPLVKDLDGLWLDGLRDYSRNQFHGTLADDGSLTVHDGHKALACFDRNGYMSVTDDPVFDVGLGDFEASCWMRPVGMDSTTATSYGVFTKFQDASNRFLVRIRALDVVQFMTNVGGVQRFAQDQALSVKFVNDEWQHFRVAMDRSGDAFRLWINNQLSTSLSFSLDSVDLTNTGPFCIGSGLTLGGNHQFAGYIRDFRWRKTLLPQHLRDLEYRSGYSVFKRPRLYIVPYTDTISQTQEPASGLMTFEALPVGQGVGLNSAQVIPEPLLLESEEIVHGIGLNLTATLPGPVVLAGDAVGHAVGLNLVGTVPDPLVLSGLVPVHPNFEVSAPSAFGDLTLAGYAPTHKTVPYYVTWIKNDDLGGIWTKNKDRTGTMEPE